MSKYLLVTCALFLCLVLGFSLNEKKDPDPQNMNATSIPVSMQILGHQQASNHDRAPLNSLTSVWSESFDGTFPPTGWLNVQESGTGLWSGLTTGTYPTCTPHSGTAMASFQSWSYSSSVASLISASFSLTAGQAKIGFWMMRDAGYATNADKVDFMINTTASSTGATLLGTINRSKSLAPVETGADGWYYYEFIIPASFNTATNYIIFKATSAYGNNMYLDDVSVMTLMANDVGVQSVDVGTPSMPGSITPKATVKNFGSATQTFPVTMTITPGSYTSTKTVTSLAGGTTSQVSFDNWTATNGTYTVKVITQLGTDMDRTNDTLKKTVLISDAVWTTGATITAGSYLGSGVGYSKAGNDTTYLFAVGGNAPNSSAIYKYNVKTNTWSAGPTIPASRVVLATAVVKDTVYVIAGSDGTNYSNTLYKYNIKANTITSGTALPTATLGWCKAAGYQDSLIYVVGGNDGTNVVATVYVYNALTQTWRTGTPLPQGCFGGACAITGNYIVYVGGIQGANPGSVTYKGAISQTDRSQITWTTGTAYPAGVMWKFDAAPWYNNTVIITTGTNGTSSGTWWTPAIPNPAYTYNPATDSYSPLPNLATPVLGAYVGSTQTSSAWKCIVASGYNGSAALTTTQIFTQNIVGISPIGNQLPDNYSLSQNYPNPFNPTTKINFAIKSNGFVTLKVYNILGKEVSTLVNDFKSAGTYSVDFNASSLSSGIYFYKIEANGFTDVKRMALVK